MNKKVYADHSATTYVKKSVIEEMLPYLDTKYGNSSANYSLGTEANIAVEKARNILAKSINAKPSEIYITSGGTESDNLAIKGIALANRYKGNHIITTKIEHLAILESVKALEKEGFDITYLDVDKYGRIDLEDLKNKITDKTILISVMYANNEIGTIQEIDKIGQISKDRGIIFHTDAVQAMPFIKLDVEKENIDSLSISSHKIYGPKGVGMVYIKDSVNFIRIQDGGHQEKNKRAGTENVPAIVGFAKAVEILEENKKEVTEKVKNLREYFLDRILKETDYVYLNGDRENRLAGNINIQIKDVNAADMLLKLDLRGIYVSAGSACNSKEEKPSHVLKAIGLLNKEAKESIRITLGEENTKEDVDYIVDSIKEIYKELQLT